MDNVKSFVFFSTENRNMVNVLRIIGVINILFINFTEIYSVTADWSDNVGGWLWVILALSFIRELVSIFATKVENLPRVIRGTIHSVTVLATGCASSMAFIFPKLVYLESNYKDAIEISKFKIKITRNYSIDELYDYLNTISVSNPIPVPIKMKIAESASNRAQVRDLYEEQVELMRQLSEPVVVRPMHDLEVILNWCDEHTLYVQIGVAVLVAALVVGFGYYVYTHPHVDYRDAAESLLEKSSGDIRDNLDNLRLAQNEAKSLLGQLQNTIQKAENKLGASSVSRDIYERIADLKEECKKLADSIDTGSIIQNTEIDELTTRLDELSSEIKGVSSNALEFNASVMFENTKRFTEFKEDLDSLEERFLKNFDSDTNITDDFSKKLDELTLGFERLQESVEQHNSALEKVSTQISELSATTEGRFTAAGIMMQDRRTAIEALDKDMGIVNERVGALCSLLKIALMNEEEALDKYRQFAQLYSKRGLDLLRDNLDDKPRYVQHLQRVFFAANKYTVFQAKGKGEV
jgi:methyl-accepting chemotaxis protein